MRIIGDVSHETIARAEPEEIILGIQNGVDQFATDLRLNRGDHVFDRHATQIVADDQDVGPSAAVLDEEAGDYHQLNLAAILEPISQVVLAGEEVGVKHRTQVLREEEILIELPDQALGRGLFLLLFARRRHRQNRQFLHCDETDFSERLQFAFGRPRRHLGATRHIRQREIEIGVGEEQAHQFDPLFAPKQLG